MFRGRDYIVYFSTELPFKAAPFKFYGLPGTVLQIQTKDEQINIEATSLKIKPQTETIVNPFEDKETLSWEGFVTVYKKKTVENNNKLKANMQSQIKKAKEAGYDTSGLKAITTILHVEPRLELIYPENDFSYSAKQMGQIKKQN
jgi:hypothetical protein